MALPLHDSRPQHPLRTRPTRPHLVVIEGGRRAGADDRTRSHARVAHRTAPRPRFVLRRISVAVVATILAVTAILGAGRLGGAESDAGGGVSADVTVRVRPGETLWSIAGSLDSGRDLRAVVSDIAEANGGSVDLDAGQELVIPASLADHLDRR